jgi:hypothetical protein
VLLIKQKRGRKFIMKKSIFIVVVTSVLIMLLLTGCQDPTYYLVDQEVYHATATQITTDDNDDPEYLEVSIQDRTKNPNINPEQLMYYKTSTAEMKDLFKIKDLWVVVSKYKVIDTDNNNKETSENSIDAIYTSEKEANDAFSHVVKVIPSKISKKVEINGSYFIHLVLEEEKGINVNFYPFKVTKELYDSLNINTYYNIQVQFVGENVKVLNLKEPIQKEIYDTYMSDQQALKASKK